jgi:hypothetical protein
MKKDVIKKVWPKPSGLNCRVGRFFALADRDGYGRNASAAAVKNAYRAYAVGTARAKRHCRIKPLIR